jgi:hypothetical protein
VRHPEGLVHGFLVLRAANGAPIADGDLIQNVRGDTVTSRLVFHFKDGSLHDETAVFTQNQQFRLLRDHLVQSGPAFPTPLDMVIDVAARRVTVRYGADDAKKTDVDTLDAPGALANGLIPVLLKNITAKDAVREFSYVAATPTPRLVKLTLSTAGEDRFTTGRTTRQATHSLVHVDLGGLTGFVARLFGKQPADSHVWILQGEAPAFIRSDLSFYPGGPIWRIELDRPDSMPSRGAESGVRSTK